MSKRYVRVTNRDRHGFVEFQFSIGDPTLYLEMTLPHAAFDEFCEVEKVERLDPEKARLVDQSERQWRFGCES